MGGTDHTPWRSRRRTGAPRREHSVDTIPGPYDKARGQEARTGPEEEEDSGTPTNRAGSKIPKDRDGTVCLARHENTSVEEEPAEAEEYGEQEELSEARKSGARPTCKTASRGET